MYIKRSRSPTVNIRKYNIYGIDIYLIACILEVYFDFDSRKRFLE